MAHMVRPATTQVCLPTSPFGQLARENRANPEVQVDLHWRLFWARFSREAETALWERAVEFDVGGEKCLAPSTADMLLHVCAHGARWNPMPPLRWVADAAFLIRTGTVDWTHLCVQTERLGLALPLADTLNYLRSIMRVAVPEEVIRNLVRSPPTAMERLLYELGFATANQSSPFCRYEGSPTYRLARTSPFPWCDWLLALFRSCAERAKPDGIVVMDAS